jgi:ATP-dependent Clp protease ATP-binding subunit ClpA
MPNSPVRITPPFAQTEPAAATRNPRPVPSPAAPRLGGATRRIRFDETRSQQSRRPEIFARVNEKLVFRRLSYERQLEIAEQFLASEIEFLRKRGHKLELNKSVLPFLMRKGFHPRLGARPMRDAVEKLVGDAVSACLLQERQSSGALTLD